MLYFSLVRTRPSLRRYFVKRLRRLAPAFLLAMVAAIGLTRPAPPAGVILANLAMVQSFLGTRSIDFPAWSIPFELFLPALVLPVLGVLAEMKPRPIVALTTVLCAGSATFAVLLACKLDMPLGRAFFGLALGMALARLRQQRADGADRPIMVVALFAVAIAIMALAAQFSALAALFPLISALCIFFGTQTRTFLSTAPFQAIGRWSYSIYLLHIPVLLGVQATLGSVDGDAKRKILVVVLTFVAAAAMFRFVESRFMKGGAERAQTAP